MIIKAFSDYIKTFDKQEPALKILQRWLKYKLSKTAENNIERIIHAEIEIVKDKNKDCYFKGKSKSGNELLEALYNFALSYDQQNFSRWLHQIKASDFKFSTGMDS